MSSPRVSVITPTWRREDLLVKRCIPSVQAQTYPDVEHIIVCDGPDPLMWDYMMNKLRLASEWRSKPWYYLQMPEHDPERHWGGPARLYGIEYATGDLIAYVDDDDTLRPEHCELLARALEDNPDAGFAVSVMASHSTSGIQDVGRGQIAAGNVGTPMIMHRREILEHGTWGAPSAFEDWDMVLSWLNEEISYVQVDAVTCDVWPSSFGHEAIR